MPQTQINGETQIRAGSITGDRLAAGTLSKASVGLGNVDNTSDANKPVSTATQTALNAKQDTSQKGQANGYASLDSGGKVPVAQLPNSIMEYQGTWNATTNTPVLANGTGNPGDVYRVTVAGTALSLTFDVGDYVIYNGTTWEKSDTTDAVASVAGRTGNVVLTKTDVGLANVDNTTDEAKPVSTATQTALNAKENTVTAGTAAQYYRGDKTFVTLNADVVPDGTTNKAFTATEKTKLSGIATGATANDTDANLKNRANHTGTQLAATISDFSTAADARFVAKHVTRETPTGLLNGTNTSYVLAFTPVTGSEEVYLNGILQEPGSGNDYTISGATITYLAAPLAADRIRVSYLK